MLIADFRKAKMFHVKHFTLTPTRYDGYGIFSAINSWRHGLEEGLNVSLFVHEGAR